MKSKLKEYEIPYSVRDKYERKQKQKEYGEFYKEKFTEQKTPEKKFSDPFGKKGLGSKGKTIKYSSRTFGDFTST